MRPKYESVPEVYEAFEEANNAFIASGAFLRTPPESMQHMVFMLDVINNLIQLSTLEVKKQLYKDTQR